MTVLTLLQDKVQTNCYCIVILMQQVKKEQMRTHTNLWTVLMFFLIFELSADNNVGSGFNMGVIQQDIVFLLSEAGRGGPV